ncbi:MAG TPA: methyltransferase domain-containing protein, partial [Dehalococcoidia bacterium]
RTYVSFLRGDIDGNLPFAPASFDLIVCGLVLGHYGDFEPIWTEFARLVRRGGHVLVTDFHPDIVAAGARTTFAYKGRKYLLPNPPHSRDDYIEAAIAAGFEVVDAVDIPLSAVSPALLSEPFAATFRDRDIGLVMLARKK